MSGPHHPGEPHPGPDQRFTEVALPPSAYADDDGSPDPQVRAALAAYEAGTGADTAVVAALLPARLLVPVVAVLETAVGDDMRPAAAGRRAADPRAEKDSHMAAVSLVLPDGRRGLLAFTGVDSLAAWDPNARPIPTSAVQAAEGAVSDGADALLLDLAGPVRCALAGRALAALAAGNPLPSVAGDPATGAAVRAALAGRAGLRAVEVSDGTAEGADLLLTVVHDPELADDGVVALAQDCADVVAALPVVAGRLRRGLAVAVVPDGAHAG